MSAAKRGTKTGDVISRYREDPTSIVARSEELLRNSDYEYLKHAKHTTHDAFHYRHAKEQGRPTGKNWRVRFFANNIWVPKLLTTKASSERKLASIDRETGAVICLEGEVSVRYAIQDNQLLAIHDFELVPGWEKGVPNLQDNFDFYRQQPPKLNLLKFKRQNFALPEKIPEFLSFIETGESDVYDEWHWQNLMDSDSSYHTLSVAQYERHLRQHPIESMKVVNDWEHGRSQCSEPGCGVVLDRFQMKYLYRKCATECSPKLFYFTGDGEGLVIHGRCRHCPKTFGGEYGIRQGYYRNPDRPSDDEYEEDDDSDVERTKTAARAIRRAKLVELKKDIESILNRQGEAAAERYFETVRNRPDVVQAGADKYSYEQITEFNVYNDKSEASEAPETFGDSDDSD